MSPRRLLRIALLLPLFAGARPSLAAQAPLVDLLSQPSSALDAPADEFVRERVRIDVAPLRDHWFAGQPIDVAVRVWLERDFIAQHLQQLSARRLDAPVQVLCPWLERDWTPSGAGEGTASVALADRAVQALRLPEREFEQRTWRGFELRARLAPQAAGPLRLAAPRLRLVYATQFRSTLLDEREATDQRIVGLSGPECVLEVEALPEQGRPLEFGGAIGRFELSSSVDRSELGVGETFRLEVRITGDGNLGDFEPPRPAPSSDFRVVGQLARREGDALVVLYDLSALSRRLVQTPTVTLHYFDPSESGGYRSASAQPIPLRVLQGAARPADDAASSPPRGMAAAGVFVIAAATLALLTGALLVLWLWLRQRKRSAE